MRWQVLLGAFIVAITLCVVVGATTVDELREIYTARALLHGAYTAGRQLLEPHTCVHDKLSAAERRANGYGTAAARAAVSPQTYGLAHEAAAAVEARGLHGRAVSEASVGNIRIYVDWRYWGAGDAMQRTCLAVGESVVVGTQSDPSVSCTETLTENCWLACTEDRVLTDAKSEYLRKVVIAEAIDWLHNALRVIPIARNLTVNTPTTCGFQGGVTIPALYLNPSGAGVAADIVLFATARPTTSSVIAFAGSCKQDQFGRPVMGHMNFGPNKISLAIEDHVMQVGVAAHEISHALGFQGGMFSSFKVGLNTTVARTSPTTSAALTATDSRTMLVTPKVVETARRHFGCESLPGGEIEDSGGSGTAGSHWEKRTYNDEFMTGTSSPKPVFSAVSLALFEDSGWYLPDYSVAQRLDWGRGKGCAFATGDCGKWATLGFGYDCEIATSGKEACSYDRKAKGFCEITSYSPTALPAKYQHFSDPYTGGYSDLSDYCPVYRPYSNGLCAYESSSTSNSLYYGENFDESALCYDSSLITKDMPSSSTVRNVCHRSLCMTASGPLRVRVGLIWLTCTSANDVLTLSTYHGSAQCPDVEFVCAGAPDVTATIIWPTFTSVAPTSVSGDGGDVVTVKGTLFFPGMVVYVGFHPCTNLVVNSTTEATCTVAPQPEVTETSKQSVSVFNQDEQGDTGFQVIEIRAASGGFLQRARDFLKKINDLIAEHWYWILPVLLLLIVLCFLARVCSSKNKNNKIAPAPPPGAHPHQRYGAPSPYGSYPRRPVDRFGTPPR